ncbi:MAG: hypothetical protein IJ987_00560, partial [Firmicutes bacterium]|nr:hypothetical protein [Bacillota bacterium]
MKKTMRFLSCLLIMAMLVTMMAVPAFAATPDGEITLVAPGTETIAGKTFDLYRIFNATVATGSDAIAYQWIEKTDDQGDPTGEYYFYDFFFGNEIKVTENAVEKKIAPLIETKANADIAEVVSWIENANTGNAWVAEFGQKLYDYIEYVEKTDADAFDAIRKSKSAGAADTSVVYNGLDYGYYLVYETTTVTTENDENLVRSAI